MNGKTQFRTLILKYPCLWDPWDFNFTDISVKNKCLIALKNECNKYSQTHLSLANVRGKVKAYQKYIRRHSKKSNSDCQPTTSENSKYYISTELNRDRRKECISIARRDTQSALDRFPRVTFECKSKMPHCSIINCLSTTKTVGAVNQDISFHRFPKDPLIKNKWIEATGRKNWFPTKHSRICSKHFHEDTFTGPSKYRRIISTAYPTIDILIMSNNEKDSNSVRQPTTSENSKLNAQSVSFRDLSYDSPLNDQREESSFSREEPMHDTEDDQDYSDNPQLEPPHLTERPRPDNPLSKEEDEYDLFGRSMAMQLRKLPELTSLELMQKMQLMMLNAKKQLSKEKSRAKPKTINPQPSTSCEKRIIVSPELSSTASSPSYKIEVMSPSETDSSVNTDRNFTYVTTVEHSEFPSGQISVVTSNVSMDALNEMKRKRSSVDPLEVQQNKHSF